MDSAKQMMGRDYYFFGKNFELESKGEVLKVYITAHAWNGRF